jgi:hypothetical protein
VTPINLQRIVTPADHREREALATMKERTRDLTFTVQWSAGRQAFIVQDENGYVLASSDQRDTALATAKRDAELASHAGARVTVIFKGRDGKPKTECVFSCRDRSENPRP